ncbi:MAG: hypothetical protein V3U92_01480 [Cellulophaga sp.]
MEFLLLFLVPITLWIASVYMLSDWNKFKSFFIVNAFLLITYVGIIIYGKNIIWKHDEYGLGMLLRLSICLISHVLIVFIFAIFKRRKLKNTIANNV